MIQVEMTEDIRKYETKAVGPFTSRQIACIIIGCVYSIPIALLIPASWTNRMFIFMFLMAPAVMAGYCKLDGTHFESLVFRIAYLYILTPTKRKYKSKNTWRKQLNKIKAKEKKQEMAKAQKAAGKTGKKKSGNKKKIDKPEVIYSKKPEFKIYR